MNPIWEEKVFFHLRRNNLCLSRVTYILFRKTLDFSFEKNFNLISFSLDKNAQDEETKEEKRIFKA